MHFTCSEEVERDLARTHTTMQLYYHPCYECTLRGTHGYPLDTLFEYIYTSRDNFLRTPGHFTCPGRQAAAGSRIHMFPCPPQQDSRENVVCDRASEMKAKEVPQGGDKNEEREQKGGLLRIEFCVSHKIIKPIETRVLGKSLTSIPPVPRKVYFPAGGSQLHWMAVQ